MGPFFSVKIYSMMQKKLVIYYLFFIITIGTDE